MLLQRKEAKCDGCEIFLLISSERPDISYPPMIASLNALGPAADFLAPADRIHQIDGISTIGLTNQHIMSLLCHGEGPAVVEIEYSLPEYSKYHRTPHMHLPFDRKNLLKWCQWVMNESLNFFTIFSVSQNSLCVTSKLAQITVERENGCLGLTLRGGGDFPLIVTHVRPHGPVFKTGRIKPGDRLLRVDNVWSNFSWSFPCFSELPIFQFSINSLIRPNRILENNCSFYMI